MEDSYDVTSFIPRTRANGRPCCTNPRMLCAECAEHHGLDLTAAASTATSYGNLTRTYDAEQGAMAMATSRRRAAAGDILKTASVPFDYVAPPDPYAEALQRRGAQKGNVVALQSGKVVLTNDGIPDPYKTALAQGRRR